MKIIGFLAFIFLIFLTGRLVLDWVRVLARDWRPAGASLVAAETIYSVTDPPLRALRKVLPPFRVGQIQIDLAFTALFLLTVMVMRLAR